MALGAGGGETQVSIQDICLNTSAYGNRLLLCKCTYRYTLMYL